MLSWIYWAIGVREEKPTQTPNSFAPLPKNKYFNYLTYNNEVFKKYGKSQKQKEQYEKYYDFYNHQ